MAPDNRRVSFAAQNEIDAEQAFLNSMKALQELDDASADTVGTENAAAEGSAPIVSDQGGVGGVADDNSTHEDTQNHGLTPSNGDAGINQSNITLTASSTRSGSPSSFKPDVPEKETPTASISTPPLSSSSSSSSQNRRTNLPFSYDEEEDTTMPESSGNVTTVQSSTSHVSNGHHVSAAPSDASTASSVTPVIPEQSSTNSANNTPPQSIISSTNPAGVMPNSSSAVSPGVTSTSTTTTITITTTAAAATAATAATATTATTASTAPATINKRKRLPQDRVGQLEDRIAEDPRGDVDAWLGLIAEHQKKAKFEEARAVFERFFQIFPACAEQWIAYAKMELANNEFHRVEQIFSRCLIPVPNVELWSMYLNYIRRRQNLNTDSGGRARSIVSQAYEFVLNNVGMDKDAGQIWQDYVVFVKSAPGNIGGNSWQDQQKMDSLRRAYQRAICSPVQGVDALWREYDAFEMGLNKITGRKFLQDKSPSYMTARSSLIELNNITAGLVRTTLPKLPPLKDYEGYEEYNKQVELWNKWIQWEKSDPLALAKDLPNGPKILRQRVIYTYKQALMALRFCPEMWFSAAEYCFSSDMPDEGTELLKQGMAANPESCLLTVKYAERLEAILPPEDEPKKRGQLVRRPYDDLLNNLYTQYALIQQREKDELARIEEMMPIRSGSPNRRIEDEDEDEEDIELITKRAEKEAHIESVKDAAKRQLMEMSRTISGVWIDLMRAMRRIEGQGKPGEIGGFRQVFIDARKRGKITSDVYIASALIEYHCYKDAVATKIFERGMKLFPEDEEFALEYLKHLIAINDITNARAVFETFVGRVPPTKAKKVFQFFYEYEAHYGDLGQIYKLEKRMTELYPNDNVLDRFTQRYSYKKIDPCKFTPVISPKTQMRPKLYTPVHQIQQVSIPSEPSTPIQQQHQISQLVSSPVVRSLEATKPMTATTSSSATTAIARIGSPKRIAEDISDNDSSSHRSKRVNRGESPLKGAAGRRLDAAKRNRRTGGEASDRRGDGDGKGDVRDGRTSTIAQIPDAVMFLLGIIPGAKSYNAVRFRPEAIVGLLRDVALPGQGSGQITQQGAQGMMGMMGYGSYGR